MLLLKVLQYGHLLKSMEVGHLQSQEIWSYFQTIKTNDFISSSLEVCHYLLIECSINILLSCLVCLCIPVILFIMYAISKNSHHRAGLFSLYYHCKAEHIWKGSHTTRLSFICIGFISILLSKNKAMVGFFIILMTWVE